MERAMLVTHLIRPGESDALPAAVRGKCIYPRSNLLLAVGPNGTGISFHAHNDAWLQLLSGGRKEWLLFPPDVSVPL